MNLDKIQKQNLELLFKKYQVALAYLFGSQVNGTARNDSDIDVAIVFDESIDRREYGTREIQLSGDIGALLGSRDVDLINLETINNPVVKHVAVFDGTVLFVQDKKKKYDMERHILQEYEDTAHLRAVQFQYLKERIRQGTFGKAVVKRSFAV